MARTFSCNEEIIVVSEGTKDLGKLAMLACDGKFHPSVIPTIERKIPMCRVVRNGSQSIPDATVTKINFGIVDFDSGNMFDGSKPTKLTVPEDGVYQAVGQVIFSEQGKNSRSIGIRINDSTSMGSQGTTANGVNAYGLNLTSVCKFKKGDYVEVIVYQNSGDALDVLSDGNTDFTSLTLYKVSD